MNQEKATANEQHLSLAILANQPSIHRNHGDFKYQQRHSHNHSRSEEESRFPEALPQAHHPNPSAFLPKPHSRRSRRGRRPPAARLWNPLNSSSRVFAPQPAPRKPIAPRQPYPDPLLPKSLNNSSDRILPTRQRDDCQSPSSLQVEPSLHDSASINLPGTGHSSRSPPFSRKGKEPAHSYNMPTTDALPISSNDSFDNPLDPSHPHHRPPKQHSPSTSAKGPERGNKSHFTNGNRRKHHSPAPEPPNETPWGPSHPCFPHLNPHVPPSSALHHSTRIIRIRRDWMKAGDLAPTFSNIYPEILDPWVSEQDFRILIQTVNDGLIKAFKPGGWRAWVDTVLGVATGWLWEDFGAAAVKREVRNVEGFIEDWNGGREGRNGEEGVKLVPLRRTGYLSLDIQIPDPHVGPASRSVTRQSTGDDGGDP
ncbi:hypothetical protein MMC22_010803 [Lobaria immixta]|nr:hypothetical protein [Lobaria immixta]